MRKEIGRNAAPWRYLFSAKGAAFRSSLGQRPRDLCNPKPPALKARFMPAAINLGLTVNRSVESRFQRWSIIRSKSWGDAPGWYENAPSALKRYLRRPRGGKNIWSSIEPVCLGPQPGRRSGPSLPKAGH